MRVALIHHWIVNWRGGEKVLAAIADEFPQADIYAHVVDREIVARELPGRNVRTTYIARLPFARRFYKQYLPLMPMALEQLDLRAYDLVVSSDAGPAKGVVVGPHTLHVSYCHSPMRYVWDMYHEYRAHSGAATRVLMAPVLHYMRLWDQVSAQRVDHYIANSAFVATRIRKYYRREAHVIHPPVAVDRFDAGKPAEDFYLWVGELVGYKRPDLVVEAFRKLGSKLVVIGDGELASTLGRTAPPNVQILGKQPFDVVRDSYARCRALVFPGIEDFGIVPVEAMASGKPVIAFDAGGARETVIDGVTGIRFGEQTAEGLADAVRRFESVADRFDRHAIRAHAAQFSESVFRSRFRDYVDELRRSRA